MSPFDISDLGVETEITIRLTSESEMVVSYVYRDEPYIEQVWIQ